MAGVIAAENKTLKYKTVISNCKNISQFYHCFYYIFCPKKYQINAALVNIGYFF